LLNEFLKEHRQAEEQEHKLAAQDSRLQQNATIRPGKSVAAEQWKETKASSTPRPWNPLQSRYFTRSP
jgi:hypothetical protein